MRYGCIGKKLAHSFSKEIHGLIADYDYELKELSPENVEKFIKEKNFLGINVTIPYKKTVIPFLDFVSSEAKEIGAVNTVVNRDGKLYGYNTDANGFEELLLINKINVKGLTIAVLGSGGTCSTVCYVLKKLGAKEIRIISRKKSDNTYTYNELYEKLSKDTSAVINTTPVGMFPDCESSPVDLKNLPNIKFVVDIIYNPLKTKLLLQAQDMGIKNCNGLYMLVSQAVYAFEHFTQREFNKERTLGIYNKMVKEKSNIVLIGMPGCGKTTIGRILAQKLNRNFIDTDQVISQRYGHPKDIILSHGEEYFREIETKIIKEFAAYNSLVIATGGGAVLKKENVNCLKQNSRIIFLNRDINAIKPTDDRPLSSDKEMLKKLFDERYPIYKSCCDIEILSAEGVKNTIKRIEEKL